VAGNMVVAWILTVPAAGLVAAACYWPIVAIF
jgi:PiT family inorganic phosphate transporter